MPDVADAPALPDPRPPQADDSSSPAAGSHWADGTDAHGTPHAHLLPDAADWFRGVAASDDAAEPAFRGTVRRLAALCDRRGLPAFAPDRRASRLTEDLLAAAKAAGMKKGDPARAVLRTVERKETPTPPDWDDANPPGFQSDAAAVGLLRSDWGRRSDAVALAWPPPEAGAAAGSAPVGLELRAFGRRLLCGAWGLSLSVNGEPVDAGADGWACVCHHADFDGGYLELQWAGDSAAGPVRVERQAFLSRRGRFAVLADAVSFTGAERSGSADARVEHAAALPLAGTGPKRVTAGVAPDTREARLFGGRPDRPKQRARVFPLNLPQETHDPADGCVEPPAGDEPQPGKLSSGWLTVRSSGRGGLYSPVVLDWHPAREDRRADWRALTVTEDRRRLTESEAAAHRLRVGRKHQLLLYRRTDGTETPGEARAVLGHHHDHETLIASFGKDGEVSPLLTV